MPAFTRRVPVSTSRSSLTSSTSPSTSTSTSTSTSIPSTSTSTSLPSSTSTSTSLPSSSSSSSSSKPLTSTSSTNSISTGLPSLDDLLSSPGLPHGSTLVVLAPDGNTAWSRLIWRYFLSRGLVDGVGCLVVAEKDEGKEALKGCMWVEDFVRDRIRDGGGDGGGDGDGDRDRGRDGGTDRDGDGDRDGGVDGDGDVDLGGERVGSSTRTSRGASTSTSRGASSSGGGDRDVASGNRNGREGRKGGVDESGAGAGSESEGEGAGLEQGQSDANGRLGARRIAWRYDNMERFRTSVGTKGKGRDLSLLRTIPPDLLRSFEADGIVTYLDSSSLSSTDILKTIHRETRTQRPVRIGVADLGGWGWGEGDMSATDVLRFLHSLRGILRDTLAGGIITLPSSVPASWSGSREAWISALSWSVDACIEFQGFGDDPTLPLAFPHSHGLFTLHSYPTTAAHALLPPTLKHSTLLGAGAGENNLGFKLKRRRFVIETVHLGVEGGVGERRTAPAEEVGRMVGRQGGAPEESQAPKMEQGIEKAKPAEYEGVEKPRGPKEETKRKPRAKVRFGGEEELGPAAKEVAVGIDAGTQVAADKHVHEHAHNHPPPKVGIRHDRPDLYEF
ncbi:PAXNEB protein-domain-containing protein [Naematelia encephala]|uniref:Elongator complex protein 4 n=1 Tax=Naematelia encephala TaxID=71784 RepID=A0A1Y2B4J2_9TREE|nr:PAXNEB protein-domain-containing protein [Naematelia encephala]